MRHTGGPILGRHWQDTHCTGKTGKMAKEIPCQGIWKLGKNTGKTQGIWFAQVVNSLILNHVNWHRGNWWSDREKTGKTQGI